MAEPATESLPKAAMDLTEETPIHVLHVDDEALFLKSAKQILELQGAFQVDIASSAEEAMKKMKKKAFDVVVSDYAMPGTDGLQFLEEIREKGNKIPFIMFTGRGREEVAVKALDLGADQYIKKIGNPETVYGKLAQSIRGAVERRRESLKK